MKEKQIIRDYKIHTVNYVLDKYNLSTYMLYKILGKKKRKGRVYTWTHSIKDKYLPLFKKYKDQRKTKKWIIATLGISEKTYIYLYNLYNKQRKF